MKDRLNGRGNIQAILVIALLVAVVFVLISYARPYYRYYTLKSFTHDELLMDVGAVNLIRQNVLRRAAQLGVPLAADNLDVNKDMVNKVITVKAHWTEDVDFWGYYNTKLHFDFEEKY